MGGSGTGSAKQKQLRDKQRASHLKKIGDERTTGRCAVCYRIIPCDGPKSRYRHVCGGREKGE